MELKWGNGLDEKALEALSQTALEQIDDKRCDSEMNDCGTESVMKLGIAFSGKKVSIKSK